jgi:IPT/TIG domain/PASTA domain
MLMLCAWAATAQGATVTVGSTQLTTGPQASGCSKLENCTFALLALPKAQGLVQSPVDGLIVKWRAKTVSATPGYAIRTLSRNAAPGMFGTEYTGGGTSTPVTPAGCCQVEEFSASLPIKAGDYIGLDAPAGGIIGRNEAAGAAMGFFWPALLEGESSTTGSFPFEPAFNVEVLPAPTITGISPATGPTAGGTSVSLTGTDFTSVTGVRFGDVPASSFTVDSESALTAVSPPAPRSEWVSVSVTTIAGSSPSTGHSLFEYVAPPPTPTCLVPDLTGRKLKSARKRAKAALCKIGRPSRRKGATARTGRIVRQVPKAGKPVPVGTKIVVTLR